jgi:bis(5'-nucleosyl)-tetraphosphatase (symmetrical)
LTVYAVGDVQGCLDALQALLEQVRFDPADDQLWLVGDLVNRGPDSLGVLRFVRSLGSCATVVLGNHDLHLLAVAEGVRELRGADTLRPVLDAPDGGELLGWLRRQPLLHVDLALGYCMVHAGIPPHWDLPTATALAREAERWLTVSGCAELVPNEVPELAELTPELTPAQRARVIVSYLTRMRVCTADGRMNLAYKGPANRAPSGFLPWFTHPERKTRDVRILFGHWAALQGEAEAENVFALDTGCVWGRALTMMRLLDYRKFACPCSDHDDAPDPDETAEQGVVPLVDSARVERT